MARLAVVVGAEACALPAGLGIPIAVRDRAAVVITDQPTDIFATADLAGGIGVVERGIVIAHQPADIGATADRTGGKGVGDRGAVVVVPYQPADEVADRAYRAGGIGVADRGA